MAKLSGTFAKSLATLLILAVWAISSGCGGPRGSVEVPADAYPVISTVDPESGRIAGGTTITLTGNYFNAATTTVTVGGSSCTELSVASLTSLTCKTPAHAAGLVNIVATNTVNGTAYATTESNAFTFVAPATLASVSPTSGGIDGGDSITITGTGFINITAVTFGSVACDSFAVVDTEHITCVTPSHGTEELVDVAVTKTNSDAGEIYTTTLTDGFEYLSTYPTVSSVAPESGGTAGGTTLSIAGDYFNIATTTVTVGGDNCGNLAVSDPTSLTCDTPPHASGLVNVVVTNTVGGTPYATTKTNAFTYVPPPTITDVDPDSGPTAGGTDIVITGTKYARCP